MSATTTPFNVQSLIDTLCEKIFTVAKDVLKSVNAVGFQDLLLQPRPNAEDKMLQVSIYNAVLTTLIGACEQRDDLEAAQRLINAREQIIRLEQLITAVKADNIPECQRLVDLLDQQAYLL